MSRARLTIDLDAIGANWRALDRLAGGAETAAVVKADAYGLGADRVAPVLARAGARRFFVAEAHEGAALRDSLGAGPEIFVLGGHMEGDGAVIAGAGLIAVHNSPAQVQRHRETLPDAPYAVQIDTGMHRLGVAPEDWPALRAALPAPGPRLVMSHLACADEPEHSMNAAQLARFREMTAGLAATLSLSATGGMLLGPDYLFDLVRPGVGLYGGLPFAAARPVVALDLPVIQTRMVAAGGSVGYAASWTADAPRRVATVSSGYADGLLRSMSNRATLHAACGTPCPMLGRVSMDLLTIDVTDLPEPPEWLRILGPEQGIDALAEMAGTIGYEILTSLGRRYERRYTGGA